MDRTLEDQLYELRDEVTTGGDVAFRRIDEHGLRRLIHHMEHSSGWAILTGYCYGQNKIENVQRNRELRGDLHRHGLDFYPLVGHWQECSVLQGNGEPVPYERCAEDKLVDVIERSYFVPKPETVVPPDFEGLIFDMAIQARQQTIVFVGNGKRGVYDSHTREECLRFSSAPLELKEIEHAHAQYVRKIRGPFRFEGIETPSGLAFGLKAFRECGFLWMPHQRGYH